jgi:hypothetical protein
MPDRIRGASPLCKLDFGRDRLKEDADGLRIVDVLVPELSDELRQLALPSHETLDRVEAFVVALNACRGY